MDKFLETTESDSKVIKNLNICIKNKDIKLVIKKLLTEGYIRQTDGFTSEHNNSSQSLLEIEEHFPDYCEASITLTPESEKDITKKENDGPISL